MEYSLVLIEISDKRLDATLVVEGVGTAVAFVLNHNTQTTVQETEFAQACRQRLEVVFRGLRKDLSIGFKCHGGADTLGGTNLLQWHLGRATAIALLVHMPVAVDL